MLGRSRLLLTAAVPTMATGIVPATTTTCRPSISSSVNGAYDKSEKNPARAVIRFLRSKPNNERVPISSVDLWNQLRSDPVTKHMNIHSYEFFKDYVLKPLAMDKRIQKAKRELPCGKKIEGWMPHSEMKDKRVKRTLKYIAMHKHRSMTQDLHDKMWNEMLEKAYVDFSRKNDELDAMLKRKREALVTVKNRLSTIEGHVDFE